jgi:hypothetical protein
MMRNPPAWWAFTELGRNAIARHNDRAFARALLTPLTEPTTMARRKTRSHRRGHGP